MPVQATQARITDSGAELEDKQGPRATRTPQRWWRQIRSGCGGGGGGAAGMGQDLPELDLLHRGWRALRRHPPPHKGGSNTGGATAPAPSVCLCHRRAMPTPWSSSKAAMHRST